MKKLLPLLLAITYGLNIANAQTAPFARPGAKWCVADEALSGIYNYRVYHNLGDTVVNGNVCSNIEGVGLLYVRNDTVFKNANTEEFLFAYNARKGDIWKVKLFASWIPDPEDSIIPFLVDTVYKIAIRGDSLRVIQSYPYDVDSPRYNKFEIGTIVEHIGSTYYFRPGPWAIVDLDVPRTMTYSDSTMGAVNGYFQEVDSFSCSGPSGISELANKTYQVHYLQEIKTLELPIMPEYPSAIAFVYNNLGQKLFENRVADNSRIQLENLPPGVYICNIVSGGQKILSAKFVIDR